MFNVQTLMFTARIRGLSQSDLARMAGVSRQAVSLWFKSAKDGQADLRAKNLLALSRALGLYVDEITTPLPCSSAKERAPLQTSLLWDRLYPNIEDFALALSQKKPKALARLVQIYGLFCSAKMVGRIIWTAFEKYKNHIHPVRRMELEKLWHLRQSLASR